MDKCDIFEGIKRDIKRIKRDIRGFGRKKRYIKRLKDLGKISRD